MLRNFVLTAGIVALVGAPFLGCTQDFDQFDPGGGQGGSIATTTSGGTTTGTTTGTTSTGTTGTTTTSTSTSTSTTSGGGGGGSPVEDCTNNADDDGDGDKDCQDSDCQAYECVPDAPNGWTGPAILFDGDPGSVPACPAEAPDQDFDGVTGLQADPAQCSGCSCSTPDVTCTLAPLRFYDNAACGSQLGSAPQPASGCVAVAPSGGTAAYRADAPQAATAACTPSGGQPTIQPPAWDQAARLCSAPQLGHGCGGNQVCAPKGGGAFLPGACVWRAGDFACPNAYPIKHSYRDPAGVVDTRDCTACSCAAGSGTCTATTNLHSDAACAASIGAVPNDSSCNAAAVPGSIDVTITKSGSCPSSGGQPTGSTDPGPIVATVCCQ